MKLPNWFKLIWWVIITALTAWLFYSRIPAISQGHSAPVDIFIFLVLIALLLVPIFQEISFFGLKFKQALNELKQNISTQLAIFKADIQTTITNTSNVNVMLPQSAPPDEKLPLLERTIRAAITEALQQKEIAPVQPIAPESFRVDRDTDFLFRTRHTIEVKLRKIASIYADLPQRRAFPINQIVTILVKQELLHPSLANAIREIYSVCSPAIHGEPVTQAQVQFVHDVAPEVVGALEEIERRTTGST